jgi:PncC family amidohydrolase
MKIEIVSVGNELLWGLTINTNASFLSRELSQRGYAVSRHTTLSDDSETIETGFREALKRADLVIATGGLGPTIDDLTRPAAERVFSVKGEDLANSVGSALGVFYLSGGKGLVLLPGVPREMERMFLDEAMKRIERYFPLIHKQFSARCSLCLLKEVEVDPFLRELKLKYPEADIGIFPAMGTLQIVFRSEKPVEPLVNAIEKKFPAFYYGEGAIAEALHREMIASKKTLALAESCTGGAIAASLTAIPDSSKYFLGSIVAYSNVWKERFLQVSHSTIKKPGAVSLETVKEMTAGLFSETDADYAIAVSGIAGPTGGTKEKPVGTIYIAIGKRGEKTDAGLLKAPKHRASAIDLAVQVSLGALWRRLVHNTVTFS